MSDKTTGADGLFIHLRVHSAYSLLEGAITVKGLPKLCAKHGMPALAILGEGESDLLLTLLPDQTGRVAWLYVMRNPQKLAAALSAPKS